MGNFNVRLTVEDLICSKNCRDREEKTVYISDVSQSVNLKECYVLNIVSATSTYFTVIIQNGIETIIRNIYTSYPTQICLPCRCAKHLLTISGTIFPI